MNISLKKEIDLVIKKFEKSKRAKNTLKVISPLDDDELINLFHSIATNILIKAKKVEDKAPKIYGIEFNGELIKLPNGRWKWNTISDVKRAIKYWFACNVYQYFDYEQDNGNCYYTMKFGDRKLSYTSEAQDALIDIFVTILSDKIKIVELTGKV